jgi:hypothetical protein
MKLSPEALASAALVRLNSLDKAEKPFRASGYHSPASFHKDDAVGGATRAAAKYGGYAQYRPANPPIRILNN